MPHRIILFSLVLGLGLAACAPTGKTVDTAQALQIGQQVREGCVAQNLKLMLALAQRLAPFAEVKDLNQLVDLAGVPGCGLVFDRNVILSCKGLAVGGDFVDLEAELEFIGADGLPTGDPGEAVLMRVLLQVVGLDSRTEGTLIIRPDPAQGLLVDGSLSGVYLDGCKLDTAVSATAQRVADFAGLGSALIFTSGRVEIVVDDAGTQVQGTAALVGRSALVALVVDGVASQGEIALAE